MNILNNFFITSGVLSQLNRIDTGVIVVYLILMITVGVVFARFNRTLKDLFAVGGGAPWWLCGIVFITACLVRAAVERSYSCFQYYSCNNRILVLV